MSDERYEARLVDGDDRAAIGLELAPCGTAHDVRLKMTGMGTEAMAYIEMEPEEAMRMARAIITAARLLGAERCPSSHGHARRARTSSPGRSARPPPSPGPGPGDAPTGAGMRNGGDMTDSERLDALEHGMDLVHLALACMLGVSFGALLIALLGAIA